MKGQTVCRFLLAALAGVVLAGPARADLLDYVQAPDKEFHWELKQKFERPEGIIYDLHLVSQEWQGIRWEHQLQVYLPEGTRPLVAEGQTAVAGETVIADLRATARELTFRVG